MVSCTVHVLTTNPSTTQVGSIASYEVPTAGKETTEVKKEQPATEENAVKQELQTEETSEQRKTKRKLPVAPTQSGNASSGSKDPAVIAPSKKVKQEDEKSWRDTAQYQKQNTAWYDTVKRVTDEGHRSGNAPG